MEKIVKKTCYYCKIEKDTSEMQQIVIWFCNKCSEKSSVSTKKKKKDDDINI
jgi:ribosomal protein L37AE/L43A